MEDQENPKYHLWVTDEGEGYLQSLHPQQSLTFRMDPEAVKEIKNFLAKKENAEVLQGEIEFEK